MAATQGSFEKLLAKLAAPVTGKMRLLLSKNGIKNRTGALYSSCNLKIRRIGDTLSIEMVNPPSYAKYVDGWGLKRKSKWKITSGPEKGRDSKIPTNYMDPFRKLMSTEAARREIGRFVVSDIVNMIEEMKREFRRIS